MKRTVKGLEATFSEGVDRAICSNIPSWMNGEDRLRSALSYLSGWMHDSPAIAQALEKLIDGLTDEAARAAIAKSTGSAS